MRKFSTMDSVLFALLDYVNSFNGVMQWLESETLRLSHLRDRASDLGRRKEYPFLHFD